jgi:hypothetical protein
MRVSLRIVFLCLTPLPNLACCWQLLRQHVMEVFPADLWKTITPELYLAFWSYSLKDVFLPRDEYAKHVTRLKTEIASQEATMRVRAQRCSSTSSSLLRVSMSWTL